MSPTASPHALWPDRLFQPGPKRILAIDGGGVRGAIAIGFLQKLEAVLRVRENKPDLLLCDYFDLIGGTSVGAILAAGLAMGRTADQALESFTAMAPRLFGSALPRIPLVQGRFDSRRFAALLREELGSHTLATAPWRTGFAAVSKRVDTGSTWVLTNCPRAKYWGRDSTGAMTADGYVPNADYDLATVVQSSAAAPFFFDLVTLEIAKGDPGVFFDGAVTPHNNPALQLAMTALVPNYGFGWSPGRDKLMIVSVGAGGPRPRKPEWTGRRVLSILKALHALVSVAYDNSELSTMVLQWLGESPQPWRINGEIGDLSGAQPPGHPPMWGFVRYDAPLEPGWLHDELGLALTPREMTRLLRMDDPKLLALLHDIGSRVAERQIRQEHFSDAFSLTDLTI
jgi:hypothetical protein